MMDTIVTKEGYNLITFCRNTILTTFFTSFDYTVTLFVHAFDKKRPEVKIRYLQSKMEFSATINVYCKKVQT